MTLEEFSVIIANAEAAWEHKLPAETREMYWKTLNDLGFEETRLAMSKLISTDQFFPKIARIRESVQSVVNPMMPVSDAVALINTAISKFGYYGSSDAVKWITGQNKTLGRVVEAIGFGTICHADADRVRTEIERLYRELDQTVSEWDRLPGKVQKAITGCRQKLSASALMIESMED